MHYIITKKWIHNNQQLCNELVPFVCTFVQVNRVCHNETVYYNVIYCVIQQNVCLLLSDFVCGCHGNDMRNYEICFSRSHQFWCIGQE